MFPQRIGYTLFHIVMFKEIAAVRGVMDASPTMELCHTPSEGKPVNGSKKYEFRD
jgi:hypothetical protein